MRPRSRPRLRPAGRIPRPVCRHQSEHQSGRLRLDPLLVAALLLAGLLAWLATPRLIDGILAAPCNEVPTLLRANRQLPIETLRGCIADQYRRLRWDESRATPDTLGLLHQALAEADELPPAERRAQLAQAEAMTVLAVARAPLDTALWTRLASLRWRLYEQAETTLPALRQATLSAPFEPGLTFHRLTLWLRVAAAPDAVLEAADRRLLRRQLRIAAELDTARLAALGRAHRLPAWLSEALDAALAGATNPSPDLAPPR